LQVKTPTRSSPQPLTNNEHSRTDQEVVRQTPGISSSADSPSLSSSAQRSSPTLTNPQSEVKTPLTSSTQEPPILSPVRSDLQSPEIHAAGQEAFAVEASSSTPVVYVTPCKETVQQPAPPNANGQHVVNRSDSSRTSSSNEIIEWHEGDEYDPDEYEVVEIEVTDSEAESDEPEDLESPCNLSNNCQDRTISEQDNSPSVKDSRKAAMKSLEKLHIFDDYERLLGAQDQESPSPKLVHRLSPIESASPSPSPMSPASPRPVRDDDSWIAGKPFYKLGAK